MPEEIIRYIPPFADTSSPRLKGEEMAVEDRIDNFKEVESGFNEKDAKKEADRCLSCRRCLGCALCAYECKEQAVDFDMKEEYLDLNVDLIVVTQDARRFSKDVNSEWSCKDFLNVCSEIQFERMLSPTGPYDGLILKPSCGDIPKKIAFISTNKEENQLRIQYMKKLLILAREKVKDLEVSIFTDYKEEFDDLKPLPLYLKRGIENIIEREDKNLEITLKNGGDSESQIFDLIVFFGEPELSSFLKGVFRNLGLNVRNNSFGCKRDIVLVPTSKSGVFLTGNVEEVNDK
ncbi:MAG: hypothetical protein SV062_12350 [Thermodesulfobacteriota bacterium]|nr:hypothetical protein [Thermodesulfobacteriota bacterium]